MLDAESQKFDPSHEAGFRRGFTHGVQRVIAAVEPHLTAAQLSKLNRWAQDEVAPWAANRAEPTMEPPGPPNISE